MKTQRTKVLLALREAGEQGINSYTARTQLQIIQLPTRIWELKRLGHNIVEKHNPDKSVNYILVKEFIPERPKQPEYFFTKDGRAIPKEDFKPKQLTL